MHDNYSGINRTKCMAYAARFRRYIHEEKMALLYPISFAIVLNGFIKAIASFFQSSVMKVIGQKIIADIQLRLYEHLIYADMKFLMDYPSGNLISRFTNDINAMRKSVSDAMTGLILESCTLIGLISIMFYQSFSLAIVSILVLPLSFYPIRRLGKRMRKIAKGMQEELGDLLLDWMKLFKMHALSNLTAEKNMKYQELGLL